MLNVNNCDSRRHFITNNTRGCVFLLIVVMLIVVVVNKIKLKKYFIALFNKYRAGRTI